MIGQCFAIAQRMNCTQSKQCADLVIEPDVTGYRYDDFEHSADLVRIGEAATREVKGLYTSRGEDVGSRGLTVGDGPA